MVWWDVASLGAGIGDSVDTVVDVDEYENGTNHARGRSLEVDAYLLLVMEHGGEKEFRIVKDGRSCI